MNKVILFYKFVPVPDPETTMFWQRQLCETLNLKGRIIISKHGINGTLGGNVKDVKKYKRTMNDHTLFKKIKYKWSDGSENDFPKLSVKVKPELVAFDVPDDIKVDETGVKGGGKHLKPEEVHKLVEERGDDVIFFDGRNAYEARVGKFKNAIVPNTETTRDFVKEIESGKYNELKDRPIVTYCTGGVRCEILSTLMIDRGFKEVYQIDGGIVKYGEKYKNDGLWEGSLYIFDKRLNHKFDPEAPDIGDCDYCQSKTSRFINCENQKCNKRMLVCEGCSQITACQNCAPVKSAK